MTRHRVVLRAAAERDIEAVVDHLAATGAPEVAESFIADLEQAFARLRRLPRSGSLRFAHELALPELRALPLGRHPYLVFYRATSASGGTLVDVWRILHTRRDLSAELP